MPIPVLCPGCSVRLTAPDAAAGKNLKCPKCATLMTIPAPDAADDIEVVDEPPKPAPRKTSAQPVRPGPGSSRQTAAAPRKPVKTDVVVDDDDDDRPRKRRRDEDDDDEDDRPRKKKGKKKAKSGGPSPVVLIAAGAAFLLLLGGGGAAIWYLTKEKPKDAAAGGSGDTTPGGGGAKGTPPAGWVAFSPPTGGFKVYFPSAPKYTPKPPAQPVRSKTSVMYTGGDEDEKVSGQVRVIYFPPNTDAAAKEAELERETDPTRELGKKIDRGVKVLGRNKEATLAGQKATEVVVELDLTELLKDAPPELRKDKQGRPLPTRITIILRAIVSGDRVYIVMLMSAGGRHPDERSFFDSFELIPETAGDGGGGKTEAVPTPPRGGKPKP
jgi:hypothetical protein